MDSKQDIDEKESRPLALLALTVATVITAGSVYLFLAMPSLIASGGIPAAQQDFLRLSPIFFPRLTFGLLAFLGLSYLVGAVRRLPTTKGGRVFSGKGTLRNVLIITAFSIIYPFLLPWLGYGLSSILLMGGMTVFLGTRVWWRVIAFGVLVPVAIRFIFERLLSISLPNAVFEKLEAIEEALMQLLLQLFF